MFLLHRFLIANFLALLLVIVAAAPRPAIEYENPIVSSTERQLSTAAECYAQDTLVCRLTATGGSTVTGTVMLFPTFWKSRPGAKCGIRIRAFLQGLKPGKHGFHAHTYGDIRKDDGSFAGGHFTNPAGLPSRHDYPSTWPRHWGDFGNLEAKADGKAFYDKTDFLIRSYAMAGRSIIIHADEDKGPSEQPSGASGARIAHCVIGIANPDAPRV